MLGRALEVLEQRFGHKDFRSPLQRDAVLAAIQGGIAKHTVSNASWTGLL